MGIRRTRKLENIPIEMSYSLSIEKKNQLIRFETLFRLFLKFPTIAPAHFKKYLMLLFHFSSFTLLYSIFALPSWPHFGVVIQQLNRLRNILNASIKPIALANRIKNIDSTWKDLHLLPLQFRERLRFTTDISLKPILLTWINFNPTMDKWLHVLCRAGWNDFSFPKLQRL